MYVHQRVSQNARRLSAGLFYSKNPLEIEICIPKDANFFNVFGVMGSFITSMFVKIPTEREEIVASCNMKRFVANKQFVMRVNTSNTKLGPILFKLFL